MAATPGAGWTRTKCRTISSRNVSVRERGRAPHQYEIWLGTSAITLPLRDA